MNGLVPLNSFPLYIDRCSKHGKQQFFGEFIEIDYKKGCIRLFSFCDLCSRECSNLDDLKGYIIQYSIFDWVEYFKVSWSNDN